MVLVASFNVAGYRIRALLEEKLKGPEVLQRPLLRTSLLPDTAGHNQCDVVLLLSVAELPDRGYNPLQNLLKALQDGDQSLVVLLQRRYFDGAAEPQPLASACEQWAIKLKTRHGCEQSIP